MSATVIYKAPQSDKVQLAGDFSNWKPIDLSWRPESQDFYVDIVGLVPGAKYQYKFIINDNWCLDTVSSREDDGHGNINHVLNAEAVPTPTESAPAPVPVPILESSSQSTPSETSSIATEETAQSRRETTSSSPFSGTEEKGTIGSNGSNKQPIIVKQSVDSMRSESALVGSDPVTVSRISRSVEPLNVSERVEQEKPKTTNSDVTPSKETKAEPTLISSKTTEAPKPQGTEPDLTKPMKTESPEVTGRSSEIQANETKPVKTSNAGNEGDSADPSKADDMLKPDEPSQSALLKPTVVETQTFDRHTNPDEPSINNIVQTSPTSASALVNDVPATAETTDESAALSSRTKPKLVSTLRESSSTRDAREQGQAGKKKSFFKRLFG